MLMPNREQCLRRMAVRSCRGDRTEVSSKHKGHLLCRCPLHGTPDQTLTGGLPLRRSLQTLFIRNHRRLKTIDITGFFRVSLLNGPHHILLISVVFLSCI